MEESRSGEEGATTGGVKRSPELLSKSFLGDLLAMRRKLWRILVGRILWSAVFLTGYFFLLRSDHPLLALVSLFSATVCIARGIRTLGVMRRNSWMSKQFKGAMPYFLMRAHGALEKPPEGARHLLMRFYPSGVPGGRWSALQWMDGDRVVAAVGGRLDSPLDPLLPFIVGERGGDAMVDVASLGVAAARMESALPRERGWEKKARRRESFVEKVVEALAPSRRANVAENTATANIGKKSQNGE